jgi:hypothetical protein
LDFPFYISVSLFYSICHRVILFLASHPPLPEEGPLVAETASFDPESPKTVESRGGDEVENSSGGTDSTQSPPPADSEDQDGGRNRKRQEDLISSGTSITKDLPVVKTIYSVHPPPLSLFGMLDSDS